MAIKKEVKADILSTFFPEKNTKFYYTGISQCFIIIYCFTKLQINVIVSTKNEDGLLSCLMIFYNLVYSLNFLSFGIFFENLLNDLFLKSMHFGMKAEK